ncbi:hypothetical protein BKA65DRAFT_531190 [Rhexocercosporidium sp. MPI-PUGE-AT-0058]|nr:hypothetical protein BKA65DRAFT_531190 [Rhexocercosporidium sp. MPI-PUGE-AT-0058]
MSFALVLFYVFVVVVRGTGTFFLSVPENLYRLIGGLALCSLLLLSILIFRRPSYELFLPYITYVNGTVRIRVTASRPVDVKAGHHLFVVINWVEGKQGTLEFFIQPRRGFIRNLFSHGTTDARDIIPCLALFSGPHGISILVVEYETVLMVATDFGIAVLLSYFHICVAVESLLNDALDEDTLDDSYILDILIYVNASGIVKVPFGKRATIYLGTANIEGIL